MLPKKDHLSQVEEAYYNNTPETSALSKAGFSPKTELQCLPYRLSCASVPELSNGTPMPPRDAGEWIFTGSYDAQRLQ